ncbi:MAG: aminotransferase class IV, partial [Candidatus Theseobacter exili]|nr:aminotransferase class IV [Candidatus Theseobacter exili]
LYPDEFYENGLKIVTVPTLRIHDGFVPARVKSLNYLNNIMGKIEAINSGVIEALMLNDQGFVSECTGDNIFIVQDKTLHTPPVQSGILEGITRNSIFDIANDTGFAIKATEMTRYDLFNADECFLTGTAAGVIPVISVDGRTIGDGRPGSITKEFIEKYNELTLA